MLGKGSDSKSVSVTDRREVMERVVKELNDVLDKMEDDNQEDDNNKYSADALKAKRAVESRGLEPNSVLINGVYYDSETSRRTVGASISRAMEHFIGSVVQVFASYSKETVEGRHGPYASSTKVVQKSYVQKFKMNLRFRRRFYRKFRICFTSPNRGSMAERKKKRNHVHMGCS